MEIAHVASARLCLVLFAVSADVRGQGSTRPPAWDFVYWGNVHPNASGGFSGPGPGDLKPGQVAEVVPDGDALTGAALHIFNDAGPLFYGSVPLSPFEACDAFTVEARLKVAPGVNNGNGCVNGFQRTNLMMTISSGPDGVALDSDDVWLFWNSVVGEPCFSMNTTDSYHTYRLTITPQSGASPRWRFYIDGTMAWLQDFPLINKRFGFGDSTSFAGRHDARWHYVARTCGAFAPGELPSPTPIDQVPGQCQFSESQKIVNPAPTTRDFFGRVAMSGDHAVVGAPGSDRFGMNAGTAHVYKFDGWRWVRVAEIHASDSTTGANFGISVAMSSDVIVVGASGRGTGAPSGEGGAGAAYVFVRPKDGGWADATETAKLTPESYAEWEVLGIGVDVSGDVVVAGSEIRPDPGPFSSGSCYVFVKPGEQWVSMTAETAKLNASDQESDDRFGPGPAIDGDTVMVPSHQHDGAAGNETGAVYVFERPPGGWADMTENAILTAGDAQPGDFFGIVSLSGNTAVIGAIGDDDACTDDPDCDSGALYVFERGITGWTQRAKLIASDYASDPARITSGVTDDGRVIAARAIQVGSFLGPGKGYIFLRPGGAWMDMTETATLVASDGQDGDGLSVEAIGLGIVLAAAPATDESCPGDPGCESGSFYAFDGISDSDADGILDACDNCRGQHNPAKEDEDEDGAGGACDVCPGTPHGTAVDEMGRPLGDIDEDCDTDLDDFRLFQLGFTGVGD